MDIPAPPAAPLGLDLLSPALLQVTLTLLCASNGQASSPARAFRPREEGPPRSPAGAPSPPLPGALLREPPQLRSPGRVPGLPRLHSLCRRQKSPCAPACRPPASRCLRDGTFLSLSYTLQGSKHPAPGAQHPLRARAASPRPPLPAPAAALPGFPPYKGFPPSTCARRAYHVCRPPAALARMCAPEGQGSCSAPRCRKR